MPNSNPDVNQRVWQVVAAIPSGKVATYGDIAQKAGLARAARRVGYALKGLPTRTRIPWHRVVNSKGCISFPPGSASYKAQRDRLESEGVEFKSNGAIEMRRFRW